MQAGLHSGVTMMQIKAHILWFSAQQTVKRSNRKSSAEQSSSSIQLMDL